MTPDMPIPPSGIRPTVDMNVDELPICSMEGCPQYDGKRCRVTGDQPVKVCEPALVLLVRLLGGYEEQRDRSGVPVEELAEEFTNAEANARRWQSVADAIMSKIKAKGG
jgi:hypothetical protein